MAVSCSNCGGPHPVWDCRAKSTGGSGGSLAPPDGSKPNPYVCADAPPVDTKLGAGVDAMGSSGATTVATSAPGAKFDKKAWSREYMAGYMKQYRAEVKAGTRVPKRKGEK